MTKCSAQPSDVLADTRKSNTPVIRQGVNKIAGVTMLDSAAFSRIADLHGHAVFHD